MTLKRCDADFTGEYSVQAVNPYGEDWSKATLTVKPKAAKASGAKPKTAAKKKVGQK